MALNFAKAQKVLLGIVVSSSLFFGQGCVPVEEETQLPTEEVGEQETEAPENPIDSASFVGNLIDRFFSDDELLKTRSLINTDRVDQCDVNKHNLGLDRLADQIAYYSNVMFDPISAKVGIIGSYYNSPSDDSKYYPVSLISHPLCTSSASSLGQTIKNVPGQATINRLNRFASSINEKRQRFNNGDAEAKKELLADWGKLFSCLAYTESLSTADASASRSVASSYAPSDYTKPTGVKFYLDPAQDAASRLNIGTFQFTPNASGNIRPCIRAWNELNTSKTTCQISESSSQAELIRVLGSSYQSFNVFCGIHKAVQTFSIQVNTTAGGKTHPSNAGKGVANRCVTPHFYSGWAYNHFGPFMNSTGSNLEKLFKCVDES